MAVSKQQSTEKIKTAQGFGIKYFGENKVQEAHKKTKAFNKSSELHMIGHLQSNKAKKAVQIFDVIQTVDSLKIATKINNAAKSINKTQRIYCQVNIANDVQKKGFNPENIYSSVDDIYKMSNLSIEGIMTILPINLDDNSTKKHYNDTRRLKEKISATINKKLELSMGMSSDYIIAVSCGASIIRVGTKLFGERQ